MAGPPAGPLTVCEVRGDNGIDVHLLLGAPDIAPGAVVEAGVRTLAGSYETVPGSRLPWGEPGPGLTLREVESEVPVDRVVLDTAAFRVTADHDLLRRPALFGLATAATAAPQGHFPGAADFPLAVHQALLLRQWSAAITLFLAGKLHLHGVEPGGSSEITAPCSTT